MKKTEISYDDLIRTRDALKKQYRSEIPFAEFIAQNYGADSPMFNAQNTKGGEMKRPDILRQAADSIEMQEAAGAHPTVKCDGFLDYISECKFNLIQGYEFPLCVVECKAVFKGDTLHDTVTGRQFSVIGMSSCIPNALCASDKLEMDISRLSWHPPEKKVVLAYCAKFRDNDLWFERHNMPNVKFTFEDGVLKAVDML